MSERTGNRAVLKQDWKKDTTYEGNDISFEKELRKSIILPYSVKRK